MANEYQMALFADVLSIVNGKNQKAVEAQDGRYPIYGSGGVMGRANDYLCEADTVIIGRKGSINNPIFVGEPFWNVDTAFGLVANRAKLLPKYLYYFCISFDFTKLNTTVTMPSLTKANLLKVKLPLPPLPVQRQIAAALDKISEMKRNAVARLQKLDLLVKARFNEMFGDCDSVAMWEDVFETTTGKLDSNAAVEGGKYPFFTCAKTPFAINEYAFDCEALLLAGNNAAGIYDVKHYKGKFNAYQRTYVLRLKNRGWAYPVFKVQLEDKLALLQKSSKGSTTKYLTMGILRRLRFLLPVVESQREFAAFVEKVEALKATAQASLERVELLYRAKLQEYFG